MSQCILNQRSDSYFYTSREAVTFLLSPCSHYVLFTPAIESSSVDEAGRGKKLVHRIQLDHGTQTIKGSHWTSWADI